MRALLVGGAGFVGIHVVRRLRAEGWQVALMDLPERLAALPGDVGSVVEVLSGDVTRPLEVCSAVGNFQPDVVVYLAAYGAGGRGLQAAARLNPARAIEVNVLGFSNVIEAARIVGSTKVVFLSSTTVFGSGRLYGEREVDEGTPVSPASVYGATKVMGEALVAHYREAHGLDAIALRPTVVYGPGLWYQGVAATITRMFTSALRGQVFQLPKDDRPWDLIYVKDLAEFIYRTVVSNPGEMPSILHVSSHRASLQDVAQELARHVPGFHWEVTGEVPGAPDVPYVSIARARALDLFPQYDLRKAVQDYLQTLEGEQG